MKRRKQLPQNALLGLIVAGGALVLVAGWLLVVSPQGEKAAFLRTQAADTRLQIAQNQAALNRPATTTPEIRVADVYRLAKAMPSLTDMPDVLLELDQTAQAAGVTLSSISPGPPATAVGGYSTVPISLNVTGDFYGLTDLLYRLRNLVWVRNGALEADGRLFSVRSVALTPDTPSLTATIAVEAYVYGLAPAAAGTSAPATTTGTTTTATTTTTPPSSGPSAAGAP